MGKKYSLTHYHGNQCRNCQHPLDVSDNYCPNCGQLNSDRRLSFKDYINEYFSGVFSYDSKINLTLTTLLFNPGKITRDYIQGKRARYANPFRFYLSISIIFFILYGYLNQNNFSGAKTSEEFSQELTDDEIKDINKDMSEIPGAPKNLDSLIGLRKIIDSLPKKKEDYHEKMLTQTQLDTLPLTSTFPDQLDLYSDFREQTTIIDPEMALDSLHHNKSTFNKWMYKKVVDSNIIKNNPAIFANYIISKMPLIIFFYLPVFALFIWLIYWRRYFNYMEHLVFTFHVQSVFFVLTGIGVLLNFILGTSYVTGVFLLVFLFYLYKAMRKFYNQGRWKTLVKFLILNTIFVILAIIAGLITLFASFAIF